jgi:rubrerythrin
MSESPPGRAPATERMQRRALLSGAAVALLAGCESLVPNADKPALGPREDDIAILNGALAVEHQAIAVYEIGTVRGLLSRRALDLAARFREDHAKHAEALVRTIGRLGGRAVEGRGGAGLPATGLSSEQDILRLAVSVERSAASIYLGAVPAFSDRELAKAAAGIMGVETMHWAVLLGLLGEDPVPDPFLG